MDGKLKFEIKQAISSLELMTERYMPSWEGGGACAALNVIKQLQELNAEQAKEASTLHKKIASLELDVITSQSPYEVENLSRQTTDIQLQMALKEIERLNQGYECLLRKYEEVTKDKSDGNQDH